MKSLLLILFFAFAAADWSHCPAKCQCPAEKVFLRIFKKKYFLRIKYLKNILHTGGLRAPKIKNEHGFRVVGAKSTSFFYLKILKKIPFFQKFSKRDKPWAKGTKNPLVY